MTPDNPETTDPELVQIEDLMERRDAGRRPPRPPPIDDQDLLAQLENGSPELDELRKLYDSHPTKGAKP